MGGSGTGGWQHPAGGRARWVAVGLVLLGAALAALWFVRPAGAPPPLEVREDGRLPARPAAVDALPVRAGTWTRLDDAPLDAPGSYAGAWTGSGAGRGRLVVVGGGRTGPRRAAAYDPGARRWELLPPLPPAAAAGSGHVVVWTGREVLVWGTWEPTRTRPRGAAYDPGRRRWRTLPRGPLDDLGPYPVAAWTGAELVVWGATLAREVRPDLPAGMAYDPARDRWRALAQAPLPAVTRAAGLATPAGLVVWGSTVGPPPGTFAALYDSGADRWRRLDDPPLQEPARAAAGWTGTVLVLWGRPLPGGSSPAAAVLDLSRDVWEHHAAPAAGAWPEPVDMAGLRGVWSGRDLLVAGGPASLPPLAVDGSDPRRWRVLEGPAPPRSDPVAVWTGRELLVWGGIAPDGGRSVELHSWRPRSERDRADRRNG